MHYNIMCHKTGVDVGQTSWFDIPYSIQFTHTYKLIGALDVGHIRKCVLIMTFTLVYSLYAIIPLFSWAQGGLCFYSFTLHIVNLSRDIFSRNCSLGGWITFVGREDVNNIQKTNKICYYLGGKFKTWGGGELGGIFPLKALKKTKKKHCMAT